MDTSASRHELRDVLVQAGIGFEAEPDVLDRRHGLPDLSLASSLATNVTIRGGLERRGIRPDNGMVATLCVGFRDRKLHMKQPDAEQDFEIQTLQGILALLKTFPEADAYWVAYDAEWPMLLRLGGRLVLSKAMTKPGSAWDRERQPYLALVDLPYTIEPLGPWKTVPFDTPLP